MRQAAKGDRVRFLTDKRSAVRDLEAYAHITGHALDATDQEGDLWRVTICCR